MFDILAEHIDVIEKIYGDRQLITRILAVKDEIIKRIKEGGKIYIFGNGGSAADAQHIATELISGFKIKNRHPIPCICLNTNVSAMTAIGNDWSFDKIFELQLSSIVNEKDIVIGISTSGKSANVLLCFRGAKYIDAMTVLLTGEGGESGYVDYVLSVPSDNTPRIQEAHILIGHILCELIEEGLYVAALP